MSTATSSLSNTRQFTSVVPSYRSLNFITGTRASDGTTYSLFEAIVRNTGEVLTIGIGTSLKGLTKEELIAKKHDLFISEGTDDVSGGKYTVLHLRGDRITDDVTNDFA